MVEGRNVETIHPIAHRLHDSVRYNSLDCIPTMRCLVPILNMDEKFQEEKGFPKHQPQAKALCYERVFF